MHAITSIGALLLGVLLGAALGQLGLRHTKFEVDTQGHFYTPHTYIGVGVSALLVARLAYRFMVIYPAAAAVPPGSNPLASYQKSPLTLAIFGLLVGYYLIYYLGVLSKSRAFKPARRRRDLHVIDRQRCHARHERAVVSKVPAVTLGFWIIKILATTLGETGGDTVTMTMNLGYLTGTAIFLTAFVILAVLQIRARNFRPALYWATIVASTTAGTTMADFADRSLGVGYAGGSTDSAGLCAGGSGGHGTGARARSRSIP